MHLSLANTIYSSTAIQNSFTVLLLIISLWPFCTLLAAGL